jgi:hypothetical protein
MAVIVDSRLRGNDGKKVCFWFFLENVNECNC